MFVQNTSQFVQRGVALLFTLNIIDAMLTIVWVQNGIATEANALMDVFLSMGTLPFLAAKLFMGTFFAVVMLMGSDYKLARIGVTVALTLYGLTMGVHLFTGIAATGLLI